jgi:hypothetical protein
LAANPTVYIIASDQTRNGKTLLARMLADYLLLDGRDPFLFDTDTPDVPLRGYFPGRTQIAEFGHVQGQIRIFDTILASTGRDYIIDLAARDRLSFFEKATEMAYASELSTLGYQVMVFFIVDHNLDSLNAFKPLTRSFAADLIVPVRNAFVGSAWPDGSDAFNIPLLAEPVMRFISDRHFSLREYILGDPQNLPESMDLSLKRFVYVVMQAFTDLEPRVSLTRLRQWK